MSVPDPSESLLLSRRPVFAGSALSIAAVGAGTSAASHPAPARSHARPADGSSNTVPTLTHVLFEDEQFDGQFVRVLDTIPTGGADFGEAFITARLIPQGDKEAWHRQWTALGNRSYAAAEMSLASGHKVSAREGFLRAVTYYRTSGIFMYAPTLDARFVSAYKMQKNAFLRASSLMDRPFQALKIPFDDAQLDAYFATPAGSGPFPTVVLVGGYDGTMEEMYFAGGEALLRHGYAIFLMDGPGQGGALIEHGLVFRPDWETVVKAEIDWLVRQPQVDSKRIALLGRSWGGYLAPRAATAESRVAAVIADAPQYAPGTNAAMLLPKEYRSELYTGDAVKLNNALYSSMERSVELKFIFNRGMLTHGFTTPLDYLRGTKAFTLEAIAPKISCPVLLTTGENDPRNGEAKALYDVLTAPKTYIAFTNAEGAGEHDEAGAAALFSQRAFDWLDRALDLKARSPHG